MIKKKENQSETYVNVMTKKKFYLVLIKLILIFIVVTGASIKNSWDFNLFFSSLVEYFALYLLVQLLPLKWSVARYITSFISTLLFLINLGVVAFSGTFTTYIMWNNLENLSALGSSLLLYLFAIVLVVMISLLPIYSLRFNNIGKLVSFTFIVLIYIFMGIFGSKTPFLGWKDFVKEYYEVVRLTVNLGENSNDKQRVYKTFERSNVENGVKTNLNKPNIIIIFTEGFSSEIMDVNNDLGLNITPNLNQFSKETLNFTDYFNHTAATYRGVRGQLFSSQQYSEGYENGTSGVAKMLQTNQVSLQKILKKQGYQTMMINPEPEQKTWTTYLKHLGFDRIVSGSSDSLTTSVGEKILADQENYNLLFNQAVKMNSMEDPFLLVDYTYQTHVGVSTDMKYGDGKNTYLNKYYNLDDAFGKFWKKIKESGLVNNTMVIFTSDHSTFPDPIYNATFKTTRNYFAAPIPLMIYYPGVEPRNINVGGKNSLSLTPTVLDLLDDEEHLNYFLGDSLFSDTKNPFQYITAIQNKLYNTQGVSQKDTMRNVGIELNNKALKYKLEEYYKISLNYR